MPSQNKHGRNGFMRESLYSIQLAVLHALVCIII
jgi:hypothetical protein